MSCRIAQLKHKDVINESNGALLGCVDDVEVNIHTACLTAIVIYGKPKYFGLFGKRTDLVIPWGNIRLIGEDTILVNCPNAPPRKKRRQFVVL